MSDPHAEWLDHEPPPPTDADYRMPFNEYLTAAHVVLALDQWDAVVAALRLYMDTDDCVCTSCVVECQGCMWCIAYTALTNAGEAVDRDDDMPS